MSAIIWWLELSWYLRALVFALSFFVCFVAPWLHGEGLLISSIPAQKPLAEKSETISAPKAERFVQQAEEQRTAPTPKVEALEEKALPEPAPKAAEEKAPAEEVHARAEVPVSPTVPAQVETAAAPAMQEHAAAEPHPTEAPAPVSHEEAVAPVEQAAAPAVHEQATAPAQVEPRPAVTHEAPASHEEAPVPAPVEIAEAPAVQEHAAAPVLAEPHPAETRAPASHEEAPAPVPAEVPLGEAAPAPQEPAAAPIQAEAKAPAHHEETPALAQHEAEKVPEQPADASVTPKAQPTGRFNIVQGASAIAVPASEAVEKQDFTASTENGGSADIEVYVVPNTAAPGEIALSIRQTASCQRSLTATTSRGRPRGMTPSLVSTLARATRRFQQRKSCAL